MQFYANESENSLFQKCREPRVKSVQYILTLFVKIIFDKEYEQQQKKIANEVSVNLIFHDLLYKYKFTILAKRISPQKSFQVGCNYI